MRAPIRPTIATGVAAILGSLVLTRGFSDTAWFGWCLVAVLVVVLVGVGARSLRVPEALVTLLQLVGLVFFYAISFAGDAAVGGVLPGPAVFAALGASLRGGLHDAQYLAAPIPTDNQISAMTALSIGLVAIVIDVLVVSLRHPAVSGLPLLAVYAVAATVAGGVSWLGFLGAGTGYLLLLTLSEREHSDRWGRVVNPPGRSGAFSGRLPTVPSSVTRIGVVTLAVALVLPIVVPGLSTNLLARLAQHGTGNADLHGSTGRGIDPFTSLAAALNDKGTVPLFSVRGVPDRYYLRTSVLDTFVGTGWRQGLQSDAGSVRLPASGSVSLQLPNEVGGFQAANAVTDIAAQIRIENYDSTALPIYYAPDRVAVQETPIRYDASESVISVASPLRRGSTYALHAELPDPTAAQLNQSPPVDPRSESRWLSLPKLPAAVGRITQQVVDGQSTPFGRARALERFFTDGSQGFVYNLQTKPGDSGNELLDFLTNRIGFCEQYASAMAVMLRLSGIPSRVVLGYTVTAQQRATGEAWQVTNHDAHAWVEAYFAGVGWTTFDPTPLGSDRSFLPGYLASSPSSSPSGPNATVPKVPRTQHTKALGPVPAHGAPNSPVSGNGGSPRPRLGVIGAVILALLLLALTPAAIRSSTRRARIRTAAGGEPGPAAHAAWAELLATGEDVVGFTAIRSESPRATATRLAATPALPPAAQAGIGLLALAEERARYARSAAVDGDVTTALRTSRRGLLAAGSRRNRLRAALLPASALRAIRSTTRLGRGGLRPTLLHGPRQPRRGESG